VPVEIVGEENENDDRQSRSSRSTGRLERQGEQYGTEEQLVRAKRVQQRNVVGKVTADHEEIDAAGDACCRQDPVEDAWHCGRVPRRTDRQEKQRIDPTDEQDPDKERIRQRKNVCVNDPSGKYRRGRKQPEPEGAFELATPPGVEQSADHCIRPASRYARRAPS
jgi:hypothetical protein